jgi:hypothetical protein
MYRGGASKLNHFTLRLKVLKDDKPMRNLKMLPRAVKSSFTKYFKSEGEYEGGKFENVVKPDEIMSIKFAKSNIIIKGSTDNPIDDDATDLDENNPDAGGPDPMVFANEVRHLSERLSDDAIEYKGVSYECSNLCLVERAPIGSNNKKAYCFKR